MSKLYFLFFSYTLFTYYTVQCKVVNTGTVLFTVSDVHRSCWHPEEIAILTTRLILQDLLPDVSALQISDNEYVEDIIDYFRLLIEVVQKTTKGRSKRITMLALTDLIGGYFQHVMLPMARYAYYAGVIDFISMEKLIQLFEELKWFLRTDGQGWAGPMQTGVEYDIQSIELSTEGMKGNKSCCRNLIYYQRSPIERNAAKESPTNLLYFPIPYFDSKVRPSAIAVPFKRYALRNIESKRAAYMVMKYYISAMNCLNDLHADKRTIENYQNNLYMWIEKSVLPKLKDDKFYSAFGGILRVEETLKAQGAKYVTVTSECVENEGDQELGTVPGGEKKSRSSLLLIAMLVTIFLWFIIGTLFICYRIRKNSRKTASKMGTGGPSSETSSSFGSSRWSSSKRTLDTCKCGTTATTENNSSLSSELDKDEYGKKGRSKDSFTFLDKSLKRGQPYSSPCLCGPPTIDPKHSMKLLPSIPEISENSSTKREDWNKSNSKKLSVIKPLFTSSREDVHESRRNASSKIRICVPKMTDVDVSACPHYDEKATSLSSFKSKSSSGKELGTQMSDAGIHKDIMQIAEDEDTKINAEQRYEISEYHTAQMMDDKDTSNENTTEETTDNTNVTANSPHIYACHSSLTGNYSTDQKLQADKPLIFGYDFQTSSSSELSGEESDAKTSTTK